MPRPAAAASALVPAQAQSADDGGTRTLIGVLAGCVAVVAAADYVSRRMKRNPAALSLADDSPENDNASPEVRRLSAVYSALHDGLLPDRILDVKLPPMPDELVELGPMPEVRYWKRHLEDGREKLHVYRHRFFERRSDEEVRRLAPVLAHDRSGNLWVVRQEHITVTSRGVEDRG